MAALQTGRAPRDHPRTMAEASGDGWYSACYLRASDSVLFVCGPNTWPIRGGQDVAVAEMDVETGTLLHWSILLPAALTPVRMFSAATEHAWWVRTVGGERTAHTLGRYEVRTSREAVCTSMIETSYKPCCQIVGEMRPGVFVAIGQYNGEEPTWQHSNDGRARDVGQVYLVMHDATLNDYVPLWIIDEEAVSVPWWSPIACDDWSVVMVGPLCWLYIDVPTGVTSRVERHCYGEDGGGVAALHINAYGVRDTYIVQANERRADYTSITTQHSYGGAIGWLPEVIPRRVAAGHRLIAYNPEPDGAIRISYRARLGVNPIPRVSATHPAMVRAARTPHPALILITRRLTMSPGSVQSFLPAWNKFGLLWPDTIHPPQFVDDLEEDLEPPP